MNNLRTPIIILVVILLALVSWYLWARESSAPTPMPAATQTMPSIIPQQQTQPITATSSPQLDPAVVAQNVVGNWQSVDDPNYSVTITADGKWTDSYQGANASSSVSETGTYTIFTSANPDKDFTGVLVPGVVYVKVAEGSTVSYFSVLASSGNELQLSYLDRGTTLSFVKEE